MLMDSYWKGRTAFQLKTVPIRRYHPNASPESIAVPKEEPKPTEVQSSTARNPVRNSQGSPDLNTDRGRTLNQKMMTFRDFDDTEFHKVLMELFNTPETETGELRTSDCLIHTPAAWIRFHHVPKEHKNLMETVNSIASPRTARSIAASTSSNASSSSTLPQA